jgi:hypothetical protein
MEEMTILPNGETVVEPVSGYDHGPVNRDQLKAGQGKPTYDICFGAFPRALAAVDAVMRQSLVERQVAVTAFHQVPDGYKEYTRALLRHIVAELGGEESDHSDLRHDFAVACNALIRLEIKLAAATKADPKQAGLPLQGEDASHGK